jgi:hypothetical protein
MMSPRFTPIRNVIRFSSGCRGVAFDHPSLHGNRAEDGFDHAWELDQNAVAG